MDPSAGSPNSPQRAWTLPHSGPEQLWRYYWISFSIARWPARPCRLRSCPHVPHVQLRPANHLDSELLSAPQRRIRHSLHSLCTIPTVRPCCLFWKQHVSLSLLQGNTEKQQHSPLLWGFPANPAWNWMLFWTWPGPGLLLPVDSFWLFPWTARLLK